MDADSIIETLLQSLIVGGAAFAAISAKVRWISDSVTRAHRRIDSHLQGHK